MDLVKVKNFPNRMYAERARQSLDVENIPSIIQSVDTGFLGAGGAAGLPQGPICMSPASSFSVRSKS